MKNVSPGIMPAIFQGLESLFPNTTVGSSKENIFQEPHRPHPVLPSDRTAPHSYFRHAIFIFTFSGHGPFHSVGNCDLSNLSALDKNFQYLSDFNSVEVLFKYRGKFGQGFLSTLAGL